jgi:predicted metal-dependent phosphoesterase TrpH
MHAANHDTIKADLHNHSTASDGKLQPEKLVRLAAKLGIQVLSLTDHDTISGLPQALRAARLHDVTLIPGFEYTRGSFDVPAHILVYNDSLQELQKTVKLSFVELLDACKEQSVICMIAHPFGRYSLIGFPIMKLIDRVKHHIAGIEIANGAAGYLANLRAIRCFARCNPGSWIATAGSDSHDPETLGTAYLELWDRPRNLDELLDLLRNNGIASVHFSKNPFEPYIRFIKSKLRKL